jgi:hypothetical protein
VGSYCLLPLPYCLYYSILKWTATPQCCPAKGSVRPCAPHHLVVHHGGNLRSNTTVVALPMASFPFSSSNSHPEDPLLHIELEGEGMCTVLYLWFLGPTFLLSPVRDETNLIDIGPARGSEPPLSTRTPTEGTKIQSQASPVRCIFLSSLFSSSLSLSLSLSQGFMASCLQIRHTSAPTLTLLFSQ